MNWICIIVSYRYGSFILSIRILKLIRMRWSIWFPSLTCTCNFDVEKFAECQFLNETEDENKWMHEFLRLFHRHRLDDGIAVVVIVIFPRSDSFTNRRRGQLWITGSLDYYFQFIFRHFRELFRCGCGCVSFFGILILQSSPFIPCHYSAYRTVV